MSTSRLTVALSSLALLLGLALAGYRQSLTPNPQPLTPTLTGQPELCLTCHTGIEEISASHPVEVFGCARCHGGEGAGGQHDDLEH